MADIEKAKYYFDKATKAYNREDYKTAKKDYEKAIDLNPKFIEGYFFLANLISKYFKENSVAKKYYEKAIKIGAEIGINYAEIHTNLAILLENNFQEYEEAKNHYYKALEINDKLKEAHNGLGILLSNYFDEYEEAKKCYEKAINLDKNFYHAHHNLANLLFEQFDDVKKAQYHFLKAIEINEKSDISRLNLNDILTFKEQTYIIEFNIKKVRHLNIPSIELSNSEKKHLLFTGKNGSGKTSVLKEAKEYFKKILEMPVEKLFTEEGKKEFLSKNEDYKLKFKVNTDLLTLRLKYETGNFIAAYFPARRKLDLQALERLPKSIDIPLTAKISDRLNDDLIDYYWNIKTQALLALEKGDTTKKKNLDSLINAFVDKFKIIDSRIKKVEFTAENGKYNIEFIPEEPYEKFDFSTLADGYASIFDFISEIILRMSNKTDDVFNLEGIVLIDEPETHLHIDMQKQVLPMLAEFFPNVQFIVATHSPFVLNSVANSVVYDLETGVRTEKLSKIPIENITDYLKLTKEDVKNIEDEIDEFIDLIELVKKDKITQEQGNRIAELDLKLNKSVPKISDDSFKKFKEAQKYLY